MVGITAVIACRNCLAFIETAVASVLGQERRPDEVIVVDDASDDGTAERVAAIPGVRLLRNPVRRERSWSRNLAIREASHEWIAFNDGDDLWLPRRLSLQQAALAASPEADLLYGTAGVLRQDGVAEPPIGAPLPEQDAYGALLELNRIPFLTVLVRRDVLLAVGGFDETPWVQGVEDYDLWLRLARRGCRMRYVAGPLALYRRHAGQSTAAWFAATRREHRVRRRELVRGGRASAWQALRLVVLRPPAIAGSAVARRDPVTGGCAGRLGLMLWAAVQACISLPAVIGMLLRGRARRP